MWMIGGDMDRSTATTMSMISMIVVYIGLGLVTLSFVVQLIKGFSYLFDALSSGNMLILAVSGGSLIISLIWLVLRAVSAYFHHTKVYSNMKEGVFGGYVKRKLLIALILAFVTFNVIPFVLDLMVFVSWGSMSTARSGTVGELYQ